MSDLLDADPNLDATLDSRPAFARNFPKDDALDALVTAFSRGDFRCVREGAPKLAEQSEDHAIQAAARELRRRIDPSPVALYLVALGFMLLVVLYGHYLTRSAG